MAARRWRTEGRSTSSGVAAMFATLVPELGVLMNAQASAVSVLGEVFYQLDEHRDVVPPALHGIVATGEEAIERLTALFIAQQRLLGYRP